MIARKRLSRRTLLRGLGAAISLPLLDSMAPACEVSPAAASKAAVRMGYVYVPNGIITSALTPASEGSAFEITRLLEPMAPFREDLLVLSGLTHNSGRALGDGAGDHARAASTYLTGVHPKKTAGADISVGVSVDQVAAMQLGGLTKYPSIELGCEDGGLVGSCDSGYSCAYTNSISWRSPSTPLPPEINPRSVFEKLFGTGTPEPAEARAKRREYEKSILDSVMDETRQLTGQLGATDRRKMDEYLTSVREIERRIQVSERDAQTIALPLERPDGVPADYAEHVRLMFDLLTAAYQTDLTRISTFMLAREGSSRAYREIGISDGHHPLTHHRNNPEMIEKVTAINRFHMEQFAYFIGKLKATPDGDGTLLDHTAVVYGSGLGDGNRHGHDDLPCLLVGGGACGWKSGRHIRYPKETPMTNLHMAMLDRMGVHVESLGDSNGELRFLTNLT